jgi:hypothetical protein
VTLSGKLRRLSDWFPRYICSCLSRACARQISVPSTNQSGAWGAAATLQLGLCIHLSIYLPHTTSRGLEYELRYCTIVRVFNSSIHAHYISLLFILATRHITIDTVTISVETTEFMPRNCDIAVDDSNMVVVSELHTKYATPRRLSRELENLLGGSGFQVEVRKKMVYFLLQIRLTFLPDAP